MNGFEEACGVEREAWRILEPFLEREADSGRFVVTNKGTLGRFLQETIGDVLVMRKGRVWAVEIKAERKFTTRLFLEMWSNRNLDVLDSHAYRGSNPGWMFKSRADLLFYYFLPPADLLYIISMFALKRWAFGHNEYAGKIYDHVELQARAYDQLNDTWGRCVPIETLKQEIEVPVQCFSVAQLSLKLKTQGVA